MSRRKTKADRVREGRLARRVYRSEQKAEAWVLRAAGLSYGAIARELYRSDTTIRRWLTEAEAS